MIKGNCRCGAVTYEYNDSPEFAISCNCSTCRRLGTRWIYTEIENVTFSDAPTIRFTHSDEELAFHSCPTCGATSHWISTDPENRNRIAVNLNLAELDVIKSVPLRHFDGADSWSFADKGY